MIEPMIKALRYLKSYSATEGSFVENVLTLMTGTTIAQIIPILISPILTRIYTPKDFGIIALFLALAALVAVLSNGRYELTIMLPEKDEDAINIAALSTIIAFVVSFVALLMVLIFHAPITNILGNPEISNWLSLIPLTVLLTGIYQTLNYWSNRKKQYTRLAMSMVSQSTATAVTNIGMGFSGYGASGLVFGSIAGQGMSAGILGLQVWNDIKKIKDQVTYKKIKYLFLKYLDYPKKSAIGAFLNTVSYQVEFILLSAFYNLVSLGYYYFINRIVLIPKTFLSGAVWQVFLGENSRKTKEQILSSLSRYQRKMLEFTTLPFYSSLFIASNLFVFIFGEHWHEATVFLYPLIVSAHINLIVASFSLFTILNRPDAEMWFNAFLAASKISAMVLTYLIFKNILYSVIAISVIQCILFLLLGSWNYKQLGKSRLYFSSLYGNHLLNIMPHIIILSGVAYLADNFSVLFIAVFILNVVHIARQKRMLSYAKS